MGTVTFVTAMTERLASDLLPTPDALSSLPLRAWGGPALNRDYCCPWRLVGGWRGYSSGQDVPEWQEPGLAFFSSVSVSLTRL